MLSFAWEFQRCRKIQWKRWKNSHWVWFNQRHNRSRQWYCRCKIRMCLLLFPFHTFGILNFICFELCVHRLTASWTNAARLSFIENQIQTCLAIQSATELEHWYSILGVHLSKHGDEKRIRTHLDDLLGTPDNLMELDGNEPAKETILVWNLDSASKWFFSTYRALFLFQFVQGIDKHKLLKCLLGHLKLVPRWQRIYIEYSEQLKDLP